MPQCLLLMLFIFVLRVETNFEGREVDLMWFFFLAPTKQFWDPHLKVQTDAMVVGCLTRERVLNWCAAAGKLCSHRLRQTTFP